MTKKTILLIAALAATASTASAFEVKSTEIYGGWQRSQIQTADYDSFNMGVDATATLTDQIELDFGLGYGSPDSAVGLIDNLFRLSVAGNYNFANDFQAGVFLDSTSYSGIISGWSHVYGVQAAYSVDAIDVSAFYGIGDYSDLGAPTDSYVVGATGNYTFANGMDVGAFVLEEKMGNSTKMSEYGVTAGYQLPTQTPLYLVASYSRQDGQNNAANQFGLSVSFPLKGEVSKGRKAFSERSVYQNAWSTIGTTY